MNGIYWIYGPPPAPLPGSPRVPTPLAVVLCPRGGRYLDGELTHLKRYGIQTIVSLLSEEQVIMLDLAAEGAAARRIGIQFLHHPMPDHQLPPDRQAFRGFVADLAHRVGGGQRIGIHCWGSIGRATVTAACTLVHLGWDPCKALAAVEEARGLPVPDTEEQQHWILNYKADR